MPDSDHHVRELSATVGQLFSSSGFPGLLIRLGLKVCVHLPTHPPRHSDSHVEILTPRDEGIRTWLCHEGGTFMNELSALRKEAPLPLPPHEDAVRRCQLQTRK